MDDSHGQLAAQYYYGRNAGPLTPNTTISAASTQPLLSSRFTELIDDPNDVQAFPTYEAYYRAMSSRAASIIGPSSNSPPHSSTLLPPPFPAHLRSTEISRVTISTLLDDYAEPGEAHVESYSEGAMDDKAGARPASPAATVTSSESDGASGHSAKTATSTLPPSYRLRRSIPVPPALPFPVPPLPATPLEESTNINNAPLSPPASQRHRSTRRQQAPPPLEEISRGYEESWDNRGALLVTSGYADDDGPRLDGSPKSPRYPKKSVDGGVRLAGGPLGLAYPPVDEGAATRSGALAKQPPSYSHS